MSKGFVIDPLREPTLLPCGAYVSPRVREVRCQDCYGRRECRCGKGTRMPCENGTHFTPGGKRASTANGRLNRGFVDLNAGRRGLGKGASW